MRLKLVPRVANLVLFITREADCDGNGLGCRSGQHLIVTGQVLGVDQDPPWIAPKCLP
jgi:hypothetical protein